MDCQGIPYLPHLYWTFSLVCFSVIWVGFVWAGGEALKDLLLDVLSIISATKRDTSIHFLKNTIYFPYEFTRFSKTVLNSSSWLFENNFTIKTNTLKKSLHFWNKSYVVTDIFDILLIVLANKLFRTVHLFYSGIFL